MLNYLTQSVVSWREGTGRIMEKREDAAPKGLLLSAIYTGPPGKIDMERNEVTILCFQLSIFCYLVCMRCQIFRPTPQPW